MSLLSRYGTLFLSHIAEDITDSPTFSGDYLFSLGLVLLLYFVLSFIFPFCLPLAIEFWLKIIFFAADGVPKEGLRILDVLVRLAELMMIRDKVSFVCLV